MRRIYHLITSEAWEKAAGKPYRADSLDSEGFIHCSNADQVATSANRFYADAAELFVLSLDAERLGTALRDEPASNGELFPHVYGPIGPDAVIEICPVRRGQDGKWTFGSQSEARSPLTARGRIIADFPRKVIARTTVAWHR